MCIIEARNRRPDSQRPALTAGPPQPNCDVVSMEPKWKLMDIRAAK